MAMEPYFTRPAISWISLWILFQTVPLYMNLTFPWYFLHRFVPVKWINGIVDEFYHQFLLIKKQVLL